MYALFDDAGKFLAGRVMSEADSSMQIELDSGKRVKVKNANVLLRFDKPQPADLIAAAQAKAGEIDLDLAWEFAPEGEFGFADLARDYFSASAGPELQAAALFRLFDAPHYFRRAGKGQFKKAPEETIKAALLAIERKKQLAAQIEAWAAELVAGQCPAPVREQLYKILFKPDKNAPEYKAVVDAAKQSQRARWTCSRTPAPSPAPTSSTGGASCSSSSPRAPASAAGGPGDCGRAAAGPGAGLLDRRFADHRDRRRAVGHRPGHGRGGVRRAHRRAGLAVLPDSPVDKVARERLSTVYMPGWKLTMLPDAVVQAYTLDEGRDCPAVSLYVTLDEATLAVKKSETRLERVPIAANLRHDQLDEVITEATLTGEAVADYPSRPSWPSASAWRASSRPHARWCAASPRTSTGRTTTSAWTATPASPTAARRCASASAGAAPAGPDRGRSHDPGQQHLGRLAGRAGRARHLPQPGQPGPGVKVRMGTKALPHAGMGVAQYTWATSPLRRYVDLVNQWQIIACARHGRTAALAAPFKPKDATLFSIISGFDGAYSAYNGFQSAIERFWTLRWIEQQGVTELDAAVLKDGLVRADTLPLVFRALGTESFRAAPACGCASPAWTC
jgi:exoribonuclease-2